MPYNDLVVVRIYDDAMRAHLARCLLENEGVQAFIHDEAIVGLDPILSYAVGGVKLKVQESNLRKAAEILGHVDDRPFQDEDGDVRACPKCGSSQLAWITTMERSLNGIVQMFMAMIMAIYPMKARHVLQCGHCGHVFAPEEAIRPSTVSPDESNRILPTSPSELPAQ